MSKDKLKSALSSVGNGLLTGASAIHNASVRNQITAIADEIEPLELKLQELKERKAALEAELISYR